MHLLGSRAFLLEHISLARAPLSSPIDAESHAVTKVLLSPCLTPACVSFTCQFFSVFLHSKQTPAAHFISWCYKETLRKLLGIHKVIKYFSVGTSVYLKSVVNKVV